MTKMSKILSIGGLVAGVAVIGAAVHHTPSASAAGVSHLFAGQLPKNLDVTTAADLSELAARLTFTGGAERARLCSGTPACDAGTARTSAHIEAVDQLPVSASNLPVEGVVLNRIVNTGQFTERLYGMAPGAVSYTIALPRTDSSAVGRWVLVEVNGSDRKVLASGPLASCGHGTYVGTPQADFRSCTSATTMHRDGVTQSASASTGDSDPIWASCAVGCCIGQLRPGQNPPPGQIPPGQTPPSRTN
ncbi:MAG: hypothetical protein ABJE10_19790 [bacterium]